MSVLHVAHLKKNFGGIQALRDVSLTIKPGKVNLLIGANGSGKTTLINAVSGMFSLDSGAIHFCDADITSMRPDQIFRKGLARTFQRPRLFANLSVLENLLVAQYSAGESFRLALLNHTWKGREAKAVQRALATLESLGLERLKDHLAYDLSGGQIKLLELGKTLVCDAKLVLLDEPIAGIAPKLAHDIFARIVQNCQTHGTTFLVIEHRLDIALRYADYVYVMGDGSIIAHDTPDKIMHNKAVIASYLR